MISPSQIGLSVIERRQLQGFKPKIRERKLKSYVNWATGVKAKTRKTKVGHKL
jgi:hypothetical protein